MDDPYIHELPRLAETDSWSLFKQKVCNNLLDPTYKVELARENAEKMWGCAFGNQNTCRLVMIKK